MKAQGIQNPEVDGWENKELENYIRENKIPCPECGKHNFTDVRKFNLMFKTYQGVTEDSQSEIYLRPETAQGIFCKLLKMFNAPPVKDTFWYWPNW